MVICFRFPHCWNVPLLIDVMLSGMVTDIRPVQCENAFLSINVTLSGMVIDVKPVQSMNAFFPIDVIPSAIITSCMFDLLNTDIPYLSTDTLQYIVTGLSTEPAKANALLSIDVALSGRVIDVRAVHL